MKREHTHMASTTYATVKTADMTTLRQEVAAAATSREQAHQLKVQLHQRDTRWNRFFGPNARTNEQARPSPAELLVIRKERPTDRELADADDAVLQTEARCAAADAAITLAADREFHRQERIAFTALTKVLLQARPLADEWLAIRQRRIDEVGPIVDPIACGLVNALATATPTRPSLLDIAVQAGREQDFSTRSKDVRRVRAACARDVAVELRARSQVAAGRPTASVGPWLQVMECQRPTWTRLHAIGGRDARPRARGVRDATDYLPRVREAVRICRRRAEVLLPTWIDRAEEVRRVPCRRTYGTDGVGLVNLTPTSTGDVTLTCVSCRGRFEWTREQQRLAAAFEWWPKAQPAPPKRCQACQDIQRRVHGRGHR